jgi:hypothetical protein
VHLFDAQHGAHARQQLKRVKRFRNVVVGAGIETGHFVILGCFGGQKNDGNSFVFFARSQPFDDFESIHFWHHEIEQDDVRLETSGFLKCFYAIGCALDDVVTVHELLFQEI